MTALKGATRAGAPGSNATGGFTVISWLSDEEIARIPTAGYWNDRAEEAAKVFDISTGDFASLEKYLEQKGILTQVDQLVDDLVAAGRRLAGRGASLGCGTCWLEAALLNKHTEINHIHCVEFSRHRIFELAPILLDHYGIAPERATLCLGSFNDVRLESGSLDFAILCQAFHHAHAPERLLDEVTRLLKPHGVVLIVGEHFFPPRDVASQFAKHVGKWVLNHRDYRSRAPLVPG